MDDQQHSPSCEVAHAERDFRARALATRREYLELEGAYKASIAPYLPALVPERDPLDDDDPGASNPDPEC
jgi:hypothetical protein